MVNMEKKKISIIIPAYNEAKRIKQTISEVFSYIDKNNIKAEVIIVDDGSKDTTAHTAREINDKRLVVLSYKPNQGKGYAVKSGVKNSTGSILVFLDADHSIPISHLDSFLPHLKDFDILIGSKALKSTEKVQRQKKHREFLGRCFNFVVRLITGLKFKDTQCGFKVFKGPAAKKIFSQLKVRRFSFDVEALYLAKKYKFSVKELPITLTERETSRVSIVFDSLSMLKDVVLIRLRDIKGVYKN